MLDKDIEKILNKIKNLSDLDLSQCYQDPSWEFVLDDFNDWLVISISGNQHSDFWLHSNLYPIKQSTVNDELIKKISYFNVNYPSTAYSHCSNYKNDDYIEPYWNMAKPFNQSEVPLYFHRQFEGLPDWHTEINQLLTHSLGLIWIEDKKAYCYRDEMGMVQPALKMRRIENSDKYLEIVLIQREALDKLLHLGCYALVRYYELCKTSSSMDYPPRDDNEVYTKDDSRKYLIDKVMQNNELILWMLNGLDLYKPKKEKAIALLWPGKVKRSECFTLFDWKNKKILEDYSIKSTNFSNYFTKSSLPYELSPILFNAEVLDKYKNNPDRYALSQGGINCLGGWYLKSYSINENNQVSVYAIDLNRLPYEEQLHWKYYNEKPYNLDFIENISQQAFKTDFLGEFSDPSPLDNLHDTLRLLEIKTYGEVGAIWRPKGGSFEHASRGLYPLITENKNAWHDYMLALCVFVIEGFQLDNLRSIATLIKCYDHNDQKDKMLGTIGLIGKIVVSRSDATEAKNAVSVLRNLQQSRSKGKAHGEWQTPEGSLVIDAQKRLVAITDALKTLTIIFNNLQL